MQGSASAASTCSACVGRARPAVQLERGAVLAASAPESSNDYGVVIERVIQMAGQLSKVDASQVRDRRVRIGRSSAWEQSDDLNGTFEFCGEEVLMVSIPEPPCAFAFDVAGRGFRESDRTCPQRDRSPFSTSTASTSRPAVTSASD
jgi:hypothetical protein